MGPHLRWTDLDEWSRKRNSQRHLPTLVRKLVMATGSAQTGSACRLQRGGTACLDGVICVSGGTPPYVPGGDSAWECGTDRRVRAKAIKDYDKRTAQTTPEERHAPFLFVTSRRGALARMRQRHEGEVRRLERDCRSYCRRAGELERDVSWGPGMPREHLGIRSLGERP